VRLVKEIVKPYMQLLWTGNMVQPYTTIRNPGFHSRSMHFTQPYVLSFSHREVDTLDHHGASIQLPLCERNVGLRIMHKEKKNKNDYIPFAGASFSSQIA
jgi:hypothetical protein